jgi:transposase
VIVQKFSLAETARSLEINPNMITSWMEEHEQDDDSQSFRVSGKLTPEQE